MQDYIAQVESDLRDRYGFKFFVNQPVFGVIKMRIFPAGFSPPLATPNPEAEGALRTQMRVTNNATGVGAATVGGANAALGALMLLTESGKRIWRVDVSVMASDGKSLVDMTLIGRNSVKPNNVAKTVNDLTSTGSQ